MRPSPSPLALALGGLVTLAAGMGLGRFLYTPVLPMMAADGLGPAEAGLVASANFAGYLAGALAMSLPGLTGRARGLLLAGLLLSAATSAGMALTADVAAWVVLRALGGVASAAILIMASALVVARLAAAGRGGLAALHFGGVGVGIAISAVIALAGHGNAGGWREVWLLGAALTLAAAGIAWRLIPAAPVAPPVRHGGRRAVPGLGRLLAAYFTVGFGYVITATFIVAMMRESGSGAAAETTVWALVGLSGIPSVWVWTRIGARIGVIRAFEAAMLVLAAGVALAALAPGMLGLGLAAIALGGTFIALTALGLQETARRAGGDGRGVMGLMTAAFGLGQMIGPGLAGWLREATGSYLAPSLIAALVLLLGAAILHPLGRDRA